MWVDNSPSQYDPERDTLNLIAGHRDTLRAANLLGNDQKSISPAELVAKVYTEEQVKALILILQQEMSNTATGFAMMEVSIYEMKEVVQDLNESTIRTAVDRLITMTEMFENWVKKAELIIVTRHLLEKKTELSAVTAEALKNLITQAQNVKITTDYENIKKAINFYGEKYKQAYDEAWGKVNTFFGVD
jgi:hypothetical protein